MQKNILKTDRTYSSKRLILTVCRNRPLIYSNNNPHVKCAVFRLSYKGLYFTKPLKELVKTGHRVYFHITILVNRSVQLVARNHECPKELNNVPCVIWSCIKMHATNLRNEIYFRRYILAQMTSPKMYNEDCGCNVIVC